MNRIDFMRLGAEPCPTPDNETPGNSRPISPEKRSEYMTLIARLRFSTSHEEQALILLALNAFVFGNN